jgi:hypothetical protein
MIEECLRGESMSAPRCGNGVASVVVEKGAGELVDELEAVVR